MVSARFASILVIVAGCAKPPATPTQVSVTVTKTAGGYLVGIGIDFGSSPDRPPETTPHRSEALEETIDGRSYSGLEFSVANFRVKALAADAKNGDGISVHYDGTLPFDLEVIDEMTSPLRKFQTKAPVGKGEIVIADGQLKP
jgi:hypothetical protein